MEVPRVAERRGCLPHSTQRVNFILASGGCGTGGRLAGERGRALQYGAADGVDRERLLSHGDVDLALMKTLPSRAPVSQSERPLLGGCPSGSSSLSAPSR